MSELKLLNHVKNLSTIQGTLSELVSISEFMSTFKYTSCILTRKWATSCMTVLCPRNSVILDVITFIASLTVYKDSFFSDQWRKPRVLYFSFSLLLHNSPLRAAADIERWIFSIDSGELQIIDGLADQVHVSSVSEKCLQLNYVRLVMLLLPMLSIYLFTSLHILETERETRQS